MKRAALILAALAAILTAAAAPVRTATESFVTKKIAEAVAATTNVVCSIVTNEVQSFGDWVEEWDPPYYGTVYSFSGPYYEGGETWSGFYHPKKGMGVDMSFTAAGGEFATRLVFVGDAGGTNFTLTLTRSHVTENALGLARMSDLLAHTNRTDNPHGVTAAQVGAYTKAEVDAKVENAVLPTNPTFSNAVLAVGLNIDTNSVAVLNEIASTFGDIPIEGTATTVGGLLAALAAAIAWLKRNKADKATTLAGYGITDAETKGVAIPKYEFVTAAIADGVLTVAPYTNAQITSDGTTFTVAVAEGDGKARDCQFTLDCTSLEIAPTITWGANFHPRTDAETDFACVAGVRNVYWITEYATGEFCVAGWQVADGGTSGGAA